jgi:hypothetical protein
VITNKFQQLIKLSQDGPEHDILWPRHSPDPFFFQLKQADLYLHVVGTHSKDIICHSIPELLYSLQQTSQSMQRAFDPGRIVSYFSSTQHQCSQICHDILLLVMTIQMTVSFQQDGGILGSGM